MNSTKTRAILALITAMVFWGMSAVFMRTLALSLSPENSLAVRYVLLSVVSVAGLAWLGTWRIPRADWPRFLLAGIIGMAVYNWFVNAGFELVPAGVGTLVTMVEPLMIAEALWSTNRAPPSDQYAPSRATFPVSLDCSTRRSDNAVTNTAPPVAVPNKSRDDRPALAASLHSSCDSVITTDELPVQYTAPPFEADSPSAATFPRNVVRTSCKEPLPLT